MSIRWMARALTDFGKIASYYRQEAPAFERKMMTEIFSAVSSLGEYAWKGPSTGIRDTRSLLVADTDYVVTYRVKRDVVEIVRIRHGAMRPLR